jgi:hypothetical protein
MNDIRTALCALGLLAAASAHAAGLPDPGDYVPAPAGTTVLAVYAQQQKAERVYDHGERVPGHLGLKLDLGIARAMHYFEVAGMPADVELILPVARQRVTAAGYSESGIGNVIVGATLWTLSNPEAGRHLGWAAYLSLPTGQKRDQGLAVSEDRYALDLEAGYITKLGGAWSLDLVGQLEFYGRDRTTEVSRRPMLRGLAHLSYRVSDANTLALGLRQTYGMRETQGGVTVLGARRDTNLMLTWQHQLTETVQLQLQYQKDVKVHNGPALQGLQARAVFVF